MNARGVDLPIEVDGNINLETAITCIENGADTLVAGTSSIFSPGNELHSAYREFKQGIVGHFGLTYAVSR